MPLSLYASFASRITGYFAALFLAAMSILFALWYWGLPLLELVGAGQQRLGEAMRILEVRSDLQQSLIANGIKTRRGDIQVISENKVISKQLETGAAVQQDLDRVAERLPRAYPDRVCRAWHESSWVKVPVPGL